VAQSVQAAGLRVRFIILADAGLDARHGAGGFGSDFPLAPVMAESGNCLCLAADRFAADRAVDDLVVAAFGLAGGRDFVLNHRLAGGVSQLFDGLRLTAQFFAADRAVHDLVIAACRLAGGRDFIFNDSLAFGVVQSIQAAGLRVRLIILADAGLDARHGAGGFCGDFPLAPVMAECCDGLRLAAQFFAADRAVDDLVIAACCLASGRDFVLNHDLAGRMGQLFNNLCLAAQFFTAGRAVDDLVIAAGLGARRLDAVLLNRLGLLVDMRRDHIEAVLVGRCLTVIPIRAELIRKDRGELAAGDEAFDRFIPAVGIAADRIGIRADERAACHADSRRPAGIAAVVDDQRVARGVAAVSVIGVSAVCARARQRAAVDSQAAGLDVDRSRAGDRAAAHGQIAGGQIDTGLILRDNGRAVVDIDVCSGLIRAVGRDGTVARVRNRTVYVQRRRLAAGFTERAIAPDNRLTVDHSVGRQGHDSSVVRVKASVDCAVFNCDIAVVYGHSAREGLAAQVERQALADHDALSGRVRQQFDSVTILSILDGCFQAGVHLIADLGNIRCQSIYRCVLCIARDACDLWRPACEGVDATLISVLHRRLARVDRHLTFGDRDAQQLRAVLIQESHVPAGLDRVGLVAVVLRDIALGAVRLGHFCIKGTAVDDDMAVCAGIRREAHEAAAVDDERTIVGVDIFGVVAAVDDDSTSRVPGRHVIVEAVVAVESDLIISCVNTQSAVCAADHRIGDCQLSFAGNVSAYCADHDTVSRFHSLVLAVIGNDRAAFDRDISAAVDLNAGVGVVRRGALHIADERVADRAVCSSLDLDTLGEGAAAAVGTVDVTVGDVEAAAVEKYAAAVEVREVHIVKVHRAGEVGGNIDGRMADVRRGVVAEVPDLQVPQRDRAAAGDEDIILSGHRALAVDRVERVALLVSRAGDGQRLVDHKFAAVRQGRIVRQQFDSGTSFGIFHRRLEARIQRVADLRHGCLGLCIGIGLVI